MNDDTLHSPPSSDRERWRVLRQLEAWLETPMLVLGLAWLALLVLELTRGLGAVLQAAATGIWGIFLLDFGVRLALAPHKLRFLRTNWLTVISLIVPALRILRIARVVRVLRLARATRGIRLVKVVGSLNRGMRALGRAMGRRGAGYVVALTVVVMFVGAAGMLALEGPTSGGGLKGYGNALWWTAMILTTMGSEYWPKTPEGRLLCLLLAVYAFAVFGYVTAALATFFIGRDAASNKSEVPSSSSIERLRDEIAALRRELNDKLGPRPSHP